MPGLINQMQGLVDLVRRRQHRDQDAHLAVMRCAQDGAQLAVKHLRLRQAQADGAQPERGIGSHALRGVDPLVRAQVEGADGDRAAVHFLDHAAIGFELLILIGQVAAVQIEELGAEQADAVGAVFPGAGDVVGKLDVGVQFDAGSVERRGFGLLQPLELGALEVQLFTAQLVFREHGSVGIDDDHAVVAVHDQHFILADQRARLVQCHHRGNVQAARDNCRVRRGAADVRDEAGELVPLEQDHVRGREVVRDQNAVFLGHAAVEQLAGPADQRLEHALHRLDDVGLAVAQVAVLDALELLDERFHLQLQRPLGVALAGFDELLRRFRQRRVIEDHQVQIEKGLELGGSADGNVLGKAGKFCARGDDCGVEAGLLFGDAGLRDFVMRDFQLRVRHQLGMPDGNAA